MSALVGGRYRIVESLGSGGHAVVYRAEDEVAGRLVALKRLHQGEHSHHRATQGRLRFRREFHTMAGLRHASIVEVYDFGLDADGPYYTMELLEGEDLRRAAPLEARAACALLRQACSALGLLHARGLVHRDVAPGNLRRDASGHIKLIDFGLVTTFGIPDEVSGTPPYVAPEAIRGLPLDHRADLFGLGALAYWVLTGVQPFDASDLVQVETAWKHRPAPPSTLASGIPAGLDELVLSMLALDRLARPASAAEVAQRLTAIAGLPPASEREVAVACFASASMVGRNQEMARLGDALSSTSYGESAAVVVEAASGAGKSRLLRELSLHAQLSGLAAARITASSGDGPYGVVRAIGRELLAAAPSEAEQAAASEIGVLGRIIPELSARFPGAVLERAPADLREARAREQRAALRWMIALARRRPLAVLVDDVQRCDEPSAAFLAALTFHSQREREVDRADGLFLVLALRTDEAQRAPDAIEAARAHSEILALRALSATDTRELLVAIFGDIPGLERPAQWVAAAAGGSPLYILELARHLVDLGILRDAAGTWVVAEAVEPGLPPPRLVDALDQRVAALSSRARRMAETLAVCAAEMPLALCADAGDLGSDEELFGAAEELERSAVVARSPGGYRFQHDGFREAVLRALTTGRERTLHRRIGDALARDLDDVSAGELLQRAGWHLYHGGDEDRGADLLERAGRQLAANHAFADAIPSLEIAIAVRDRQRVPPRHALELRRLVLEAAATTDRDAILRHAPAVIKGFGQYCCIPLIQRWSPRIGRPLALVVGMVVATLHYIVSPRRRREGPWPIDALIQWSLAIGFAGAVHAPLMDAAALEQLVRELETFRWMRGTAPRVAYLTMATVYDYVEGRYGPEQEKQLAEALRVAQSEGVPPALENMRMMGIGMMLAVRALHTGYERYPAEDLAALRGLGFRFFDALALHVEVACHRYRGEETRATQIEAEAGLAFLQIGSSWMLDSWLAVVNCATYAGNRDLGGLRRTISKVDAFVEAGFRMEPLMMLCRGEYQRELGSLDAARSSLEALLSRRQRFGGLIALWGRIALADTLLASAEYARAAELADAIRADSVLRLPEAMRIERIASLALAGLGEHEAAAARLDAALSRAAVHSIPSVSGQLHEARARVALARGLQQLAEKHLAKMTSYLRPTENPALIRLVKRLEEEIAGRSDGAAARPRSAASGTEVVERVPAARTATAAAITELVQGEGSEAGRARDALGLLMEAAHASAGCLYRLSNSGVIEAVAGLGAPPPPAAVALAIALLQHGSAAGEAEGWQAVPLRAQLSTGTGPVAVALIRCGDGPRHLPDPSFLDLIGTALASTRTLPVILTATEISAREDG